MHNHITVQGRLTALPEVRSVGSQQVSRCTFSIACQRDYKNPESGERETDFFSCVAWRGTADFIAKYVGKGDLLLVEGRLQQERWEDKDGNKRSTVKIQVTQAHPQPKPPEQSQTGYAEPYQAQPHHTPPTAQTTPQPSQNLGYGGYSGGYSVPANQGNANGGYSVPATQQAPEQGNVIDLEDPNLPF